jgi:hypothetical protein
MSLTGQGLASGFTGGFKMMDDYYNRQETQKLNREKAGRETDIYEKGLQKEKVEEALKEIAFTVSSGQMPKVETTDYLKNTIGWDLYANLNPQYVAARDSILNGEYNMGSPEFNKASNIVFGDVLNMNNSQTTFTTMGKVFPTGQLAHGGVMVQPEVVKGKKILNKKLVGGAYAMGGGVVGSDIEVVYEDADGNTKTYIAPMTQHGKTAGEADMSVGKNVDWFAGRLKGSMMLSDGMAPVLKQIKNLMMVKGINIPISDVDTSSITTYTQLYTDHMTIANNAVKNLYPKASDTDLAGIKALLGNDEAAPATATINGTVQKANPQALKIYNENVAKAKGYMDDVNAIHAKYNFGDNKSSALGHERGVPPLSLEQLAAQLAAGGPAEVKAAEVKAGEVAAGGPAEVKAGEVAAGGPAEVKAGEVVSTSGGVEAGPQDNNLEQDVARLAAAETDSAGGIVSTAKQFLGLQPERVDTNQDPLGLFVAFPTNPQVAAVDASSSGFKIRPTNRPPNMDAIDMVTDNANAIVTMAQNGTLAEWLLADPDNQRIADNTVLHMEKTRQETGAYNQGAGDRLALIISNNGPALDSPDHYKFKDWKANDQANRAAYQQQSTARAIDYTKEAVLDKEIGAMKIAINDPQVMLRVQQQVQNDPDHIKTVEDLLFNINSLPRTNKTTEQWDDVFEYWMAVNGHSSLDPAKQPTLLQKWKMGFGFGPSRFDQESKAGLMEQYQLIVGMSHNNTLKNWVEGDRYGDKYFRMKQISDVYQSLSHRGIAPHFMKKFEAAIEHSLN